MSSVTEKKLCRSADLSFDGSCYFDIAFVMVASCFSTMADESFLLILLFILPYMYSSVFYSDGWWF